MTTSGLVRMPLKKYIHTNRVKIKRSTEKLHDNV